MVRRRVPVSLLLALVGSCAERGAARRIAEQSVYRVTVVSVEVEPKRPDGRGWDEAASRGTPVRNALCALLGIGAGVSGALDSGGLVDLAAQVGTRSVCASLLGVREAAAAQAEAPDIEVEFHFGARVVKTPVAAEQFVAKLEYPFLATEADAAAEYVRIHVADVDADKAETMASLVLPTKEVLRPGLVKLSKSPGLRELALLVEQVKRETLGRRATVAVEGDERAIETDVVVLAGQRVTIKATGKVCTRWFFHGDVCAGPKGSTEGGLRSYNVEGFGRENHLALLALIGSAQIVVGAEESFEAASSGNIVFFVNDGDIDNNRGAFQVSVVVE